MDDSSSASAAKTSDRLRCHVCEYRAENPRDLVIHDCAPEVIRCKREIRAVLRAIEAKPERALELIAFLRERVRGL